MEFKPKNIFEEDTVERVDDQGVIYGIVVESYENDSSDDESTENLSGRVRVAWHPSGEEAEEDEQLVCFIFSISLFQT